MDKTSYLVNQVKAGDKKAFEELYNDYSNAIYGVINKMVNDKELSNDILQEVFIKVWNKIDAYDEEKGRFYTWVYRIARNTTINKLRRNQPENQSDDLSVYENTTSQSLNIDAIDLDKKVDQLDEKYKEVIDLVYFQGYTHKQVQEQTGIPIGTIKTRLRRGIKMLSKIYKADSLNILFILLIICGHG